MNRSENISEIAAALVAFRATVPGIERSKEVKVNNKEGKYLYSFHYAPMDAIEEICKPLLSAQKLCVIQLIEGNASVETVILHESGQYISSSFSLQPQLNGKPQEIGSAITYARRYGYCAALGLVADEDDDANASQGQYTTQKDDKPWLNKDTPEWEKVIIFLSEGGNIKAVESKFKISKSNREELLTQAV